VPGGLCAEVATGGVRKAVLSAVPLPVVTSAVQSSERVVFCRGLCQLISEKFHKQNWAAHLAKNLKFRTHPPFPPLSLSHRFLHFHSIRHAALHS